MNKIKQTSEVQLRSAMINLPVSSWIDLIIQSAPIVLSLLDKLLNRSNYKTKLDKISYLVSVYPEAAGVAKLEEAINKILNEK